MPVTSGPAHKSAAPQPKPKLAAKLDSPAPSQAAASAAGPAPPLPAFAQAALQSCEAPTAAAESGSSGEPLAIHTRTLFEQRYRPTEDQLEREADRIDRQPVGEDVPRAVQGHVTGSGIDAPHIVHDVLSRPGKPLDTASRAIMERRFSRDFSSVRVHDDTRAAAAASAVSAHAFTAGRDIVFGAGEYAPGTSDGMRLLAHELTHTIQQQSGPVGVQRKIKLKRENKWYEFGAHWTEPGVKERSRFVIAHFTVGERQFANSIVEDMSDSADDFLFDDENELAIEITKRMKTSNLMQESQASGPLGKGFGYPDKTLSARVNKAAKGYWGPVQDDYFFELSDAGRQNAYAALTTLFTPQRNKSDRTLIHCDYLASVVHFRVFAESIGAKEFNERVRTGKIPVTLKWNGFADIELGGMLRSSKQESLQEVRPSSERDLVIGDHVVFWNHRAYDLINVNVGEAWRLENAILEKKDTNGQDIFEGHGSGKLSNDGMRKALLKRYNEVVGKAQTLIAQIKSGKGPARTQALKNMATTFPNVQQAGAEWHIRGVAHEKKFDEPIKPVTDVNDPQLIGLRDPDDPAKMNFVKRPKEST